MAFRDAARFGARGDGIADDAPALQKALDATKPGDVFRLARGKRYRIGRGLHFTGSDAQIWLNDAPLILDTGAWPHNTHLSVHSKPSARPAQAFEANIPRGWFSPPPGPRPAFLMLGTDPHDGNEEHFGCLLDRFAERVFVPYAINGSSHKIEFLESICERVTIRDARFARGERGAPDMNLFASRARLISIDGIRGQATIGAQLADVDGALVRSIDVDLDNSHGAANRALSIWGSRNVNASEIVLRGERSGGFMVENWSSAIRIDQVRAEFSSADDAYGNSRPVFLINGGSQVGIGRVEIGSGGLVYPWDTGGQATPKPSWESIRVLRGDPHMVQTYFAWGWAPWQSIEGDK